MICPTVTADTPGEYRRQMQHVGNLSRRLHIDLADGTLAPRKLLPLNQIWWPEGKQIDLHVMIRYPLDLLTDILEVRPNLVIVHAEAEGDFMALAGQLHSRRIRVGVALLASTDVRSITPVLKILDHVLVFSGNFGYQGGGQVDWSLLDKVAWLKQARPELEIGWDGGINQHNVGRLAHSGIDVLNVGSAIQREPNYHIAYAKLLNEVRRIPRV